MTIPPDFAAWMQRKLLGQATDDTPSTLWHFVSGDVASVSDNSKARWQVEVDFVYRCLVCQLIYVESFFQCPDLAAFIHGIRIHDHSDSEGGVFWAGTFIDATEALVNLANKYFDVSDENVGSELNTLFIKELEHIFETNRVPWSNHALLPILST